MKTAEFNDLLSEGEGEKVEFKKTIPPGESVAKILCAFLNQRGGRLVVGVDEHGRQIGIPNADEAIQTLNENLKGLITPQPLWSADKIEIDGRDFVIFEVSEGMDKPYVTQGGVYVRKGERVAAATRDEISSLISKRALAGDRWERQIAMGVAVEDLDEALIRETAAMALSTGRWQGDVHDPKSFLYSLGLLTHSDITNAGVVLFGTKVARWFPQVRIRFVIMPTGKTGDAYEDDATFEGNLFAIAKEAFQRLTRYTGTLRTTFQHTALQREEVREYPPSAIREAVMNSIIHRDYNRSGSILIAMLPTSLKISNPGGLPRELTVADLKKDHPSVPRNPDIAHVCYLRGLIEKIGRGTQRIVEDCRRNHLRDPKWTSSESETTLTFFARTPITKGLDDLNDRQRLILHALQKQDHLSSRKVSDVLGEDVTDRTVRSDLRLLVDRGLIIQRGRGRSTSYALGRYSE